MAVPSVRTTLRYSLAGGVALALVAIIAAGPWRDGERAAVEHDRDATHTSPAAAGARSTPPAAPRIPLGPGYRPAANVLPPIAAGGSAGAAGAPTSAGLAAALGPLLSARGGLGQLTGAVLDVNSGALLYDDGASTPMAPASTSKLATATAALHLLGPDFRLRTRVLRGAAPGTIVLVGGGDPTLSTRAANAGSADDPGFRPARLADLAAATARALRAAGETRVSVGYDGSLYQESGMQDSWTNGEVVGNIAPVSALEVDEGRIEASQELSGRVGDPAAAAAQAFADLLAGDGITVAGVTGPASAPAGAAPLATVSSPPLADLVEHLLTVSDNDLAEALGRAAAIAAHEPVTFAGAVQAVRAQLVALGVPVDGMSMRDTSGLSGADRIPASTLVHLLAADAASDQPALRAVLTGLPVAAFTGTLARDGRYASGASLAGAGLVRGKTGSLTGVDTLAGVVPAADGQLLAYAFMSNGNSDAATARQTLDSLATALLSCGCAG
jgi:D-alanyl-D-alanine carboxypeptidase/D-alanyl-D-alanine-endopeptidase (penicillin-binding protein 4)